MVKDLLLNIAEEANSVKKCIECELDTVLRYMMYNFESAKILMDEMGISPYNARSINNAKLIYDDWGFDVEVVIDKRHKSESHFILRW